MYELHSFYIHGIYIYIHIYNIGFWAIICDSGQETNQEPRDPQTGRCRAQGLLHSTLQPLSGHLSTPSLSFNLKLSAGRRTLLQACSEPSLGPVSLSSPQHPEASVRPLNSDLPFASLQPTGGLAIRAAVRCALGPQASEQTVGSAPCTRVVSCGQRGLSALPPTPGEKPFPCPLPFPARLCALHGTPMFHRWCQNQQLVLSVQSPPKPQLTL